MLKKKRVLDTCVCVCVGVEEERQRDLSLCSLVCCCVDICYDNDTAFRWFVGSLDRCPFPL